MLSVICPIYNEEKYIGKCFDSILAQDYPQTDLEVLFVDGMSSDQTRLIIQEYVSHYPFLRLLNNPHKIVPYAMNIGLEASKGDIIIRLDAHVIYPNNYFSFLVDKLRVYNADNVGCICETLPANDTNISIAIAEAISSPFGVGNSMFRIGAEKDMEVDTVPFGCFRREIFDKVGYYDVDLVRNQDDELNARIINAGGRIVLLSDLSVKYFARSSLKKLYQMYYQYGLYKPLVNKKIGTPSTLRQLIPPLFVLGIVLGFILSFMLSFFAFLYGIVLALYVILSLYQGLKISVRHHRIVLLFYMPITYFTVHFSYGWGYIKGIYKVLFNKPFNVQVNH